jgi:phosphatidate phosphatase APP1
VAFLILTRAGFDDIVTRCTASGTRIYLNPGLASPDEISRLRRAGAEIHVLPTSIDPRVPEEVEQALRIAEGADGPVWLERGIPASLAAASTPSTAAPASINAGDGLAHRAFHHRLVKTVGTFAGGALRRLGRQLAIRSQLMIVPYLGFGNAQLLGVRGRVLDEVAFRTQSREDSRWSNLVALYHRLESDEVAGARVRLRFEGAEYETVTDNGGYFSFEIAPHAPLTEREWYPVELDLPGHTDRDGQPIRATADVLVPPSSARFGVISDIDDTVLWTNVTNKLNMALMLARSNAHTRKPFKGVAGFYHALRDGAGGNEHNPIFYVSGSPWHLFGPLLEFLRLQGIPVGPLMLRELRVRQLFKLKQHSNHKLDKIERILRLYPHLRFVLIGDSGEQDPEIYAEVVRRHPKAVRVIYIRNVNPDPSRIEALDRLIEEVSATGTQLILVPDSVFAATHAAAEGLIDVSQLALVRSDKKDDEGAARS